jgi:hypothetical protein
VPAGLLLNRQSDGAILLTNNLKNPVVRANASPLTQTNDITNSGVGSKLVISFTDSSPDSRPISALAGNVEAFLWRSSKSGSTWTWEYVINASVGTAVEYFVFDVPSGASTNIGLQLYADAPGSPIVFSTANNPFRLVDIITKTDYLSESLPAGKTYAIAQGKYNGFKSWDNGAINPVTGNPAMGYYALRQKAKSWQLSGTTLSFDTMQVEVGPGSLLGTQAPDYGDEVEWDSKQLLVLDVSGF